MNESLSEPHEVQIQISQREVERRDKRIRELEAVLTEIADMDFDKNEKYGDDNFYSGAPKFIEAVLKARKVLGRLHNES